ncbi:DUF6655 family protein [uncultured Victivallis sp.]|uniref:DUF6655 family protein n=1 Tax=uncultured Victivallis sp. TaxID=354118 RepID=UPI0025EF9D61|nr:DUF6655 family protein [uncultured Victivallis sp.]
MKFLPPKPDSLRADTDCCSRSGKFSLLRLLSAAAGLLLLHAGCSSPTITNTSRNIVEQLLISSAVERCMYQIDFSMYRDAKVFVDYSNLATQVDKNYVQGCFELYLSKAGIILVKEEKEAAYTMRLISGTLATSSTQVLIGTPELPIPLPNTDINFALPEIPLFKKVTRRGYGKFSLTVLESPSQKPVRTVDGVSNMSEFINWTILLIPFSSRNMEMKQSEFEDTQYYLFE